MSDSKLVYAPMEISKHTMERPTASLRWHNIVGYDKALQQRWEILHYEGNSPVRMEYEWRDVPVEN